jgi:3-methyladenine DNA glycosylase Tag
MIPNETINEMIEELQEDNNSNSHLVKHMGKIFVEENISALQELLDLRKEKEELKEQLEVHKAGKQIIDELREEKQLLIENSERLIEYAKDVSDEAYIQDSPIYNLRIDKAREACDKHNDLMKQVKGE